MRRIERGPNDATVRRCSDNHHMPPHPVRRMKPTVLALALTAVIAGGGCLQDLVPSSFGGVEPGDYIRDTTYKRWIIEVDYVSGHKPTQSWLDDLEGKLESLVRKDTIQIQMGNTLPSKSVWTSGAVRALQNDHQTTKTSGDTVVTHVVYLDGKFEKESVYGVAFDWDLIAIFTEAIDTGCTITNGCFSNTETVQRAVLVHEFGHALGLVNRGTDMVVDREGEGDQARHSTNSGSVMYWAVNNSGILGLNNIPTTFDSNDKRDIACAGGKGNC